MQLQKNVIKRVHELIKKASEELCPGLQELIGYFRCPFGVIERMSKEFSVK